MGGRGCDPLEVKIFVVAGRASTKLRVSVFGLSSFI